MPSKGTGVKPSGKRLFIDGSNVAKRAQSFSSSNDVAEEKLLELNNKEVAEKTKDLTVTSTVEFNCYGSISPFMQALGQGMWQGEDNPNRILTDTDFDNATVELLPHQSNDDLSIDFAEWCGYMFLTAFNYTFPADGIATESYDFEGEHARFFLNEWKNATVYKADYQSASQAIISGANLESTHNPILVLVNQDVQAELSDANDSITLTDNSSDTLVTASNVDGSVAFATTDRIRVIVSGSGATFSTLPSTPDGIGGLRRGHVVPRLYNPAGNQENTLRVNSLTIDGDLSREELPELGNKKSYFRKLTRPINVSVAVEFNETDLEEYAKMAGQETAYDAETLREINIDDLLRNNVLEVLVYSSETSHTFANELMRLKMTGVSVAGDDDNTAVGDTVGTRTINLTSENFLISGSGVSPFL